MQNPWDVRPKAERGDATMDNIHQNVGAALTAWESLESALGDLFDCLVSGVDEARKSNRAGFAAFTAISSSSARTEAISAAIPFALSDSQHRDRGAALLQEVSSFGARRNEIAHGRVYNLGKFGFYLGPNNTNPNKWNTKGSNIGSAKYQYVMNDLAHYIVHFARLHNEVKAITDLVFTERREKNREHDVTQS